MSKIKRKLAKLEVLINQARDKQDNKKLCEVHRKISEALTIIGRE